MRYRLGDQTPSPAEVNDSASETDMEPDQSTEEGPPAPFGFVIPEPHELLSCKLTEKEIKLVEEIQSRDEKSQSSLSPCESKVMELYEVLRWDPFTIDSELPRYWDGMMWLLRRQITALGDTQDRTIPTSPTQPSGPGVTVPDSVSEDGGSEKNHPQDQTTVYDGSGSSHRTDAQSISRPHSTSMLSADASAFTAEKQPSTSRDTQFKPFGLG